MHVKMNGYDKKETIKEKIERIAREVGWSAAIEEETNDTISYDFAKHSPAGQDFHISAMLENMEIKTLMHNLNEIHMDFDCSYETYLWLDNTGHGKQGAPYDMRDLYNDMNACRDMIMELYEAFETAEDEFDEN